MTSKELAATLNGREYRNEMTKDEEKAAKAAGLVVVFGASDDLIEFRGAIDDETGAQEVMLDAEGILPEWNDYRERMGKEDARRYLRRDMHARKIMAEWQSDGYSWTYTTDIPHETFDVMEDGERYCRGIVFTLADLGAQS